MPTRLRADRHHHNLGRPASSKTRTALLTYFGGSFNVGVTLSTLGFGTLAHAIGYRSVIAIAGVLAASSSFVLARLSEAPSQRESVRFAG